MEHDLLIVISEKGKPWKEELILDHSDLWTYTDSQSKYRFALLSQNNWKDNIGRALEQNKFDKNQDRLYVYIHETGGPSNDKVKERINEYEYYINSNQIKRFKHVDEEFAPVKNILEAAVEIKKTDEESKKKNAKKRFEQTLADILEQFKVYSAPYYLHSISFLLQAVLLKNMDDQDLNDYLENLLTNTEEINNEISRLNTINNQEYSFPHELTNHIKRRHRKSIEQESEGFYNYLESLDKPHYELDLPKNPENGTET